MRLSDPVVLSTRRIRSQIGRAEHLAEPVGERTGLWLVDTIGREVVVKVAACAAVSRGVWCCFAGDC